MPKTNLPKSLQVLKEKFTKATTSCAYPYRPIERLSAPMRLASQNAPKIIWLDKLPEKAYPILLQKLGPRETCILESFGIAPVKEASKNCDWLWQKWYMEEFGAASAVRTEVFEAKDTWKMRFQKKKKASYNWRSINYKSFELNMGKTWRILYWALDGNSLAALISTIGVGQNINSLYVAIWDMSTSIMNFFIHIGYDNAKYDFFDYCDGWIAILDTVRSKDPFSGNFNQPFVTGESRIRLWNTNPKNSTKAAKSSAFASTSVVDECFELYLGNMVDSPQVWLANSISFKPNSYSVTDKVIVLLTQPEYQDPAEECCLRVIDSRGNLTAKECYNITEILLDNYLGLVAFWNESGGSTTIQVRKLPDLDIIAVLDPKSFLQCSPEESIGYDQNSRHQLFLQNGCLGFGFWHTSKQFFFVGHLQLFNVNIEENMGFEEIRLFDISSGCASQSITGCLLHLDRPLLMVAIDKINGRSSDRHNPTFVLYKCGKAISKSDIHKMSSQSIPENEPIERIAEVDFKAEIIVFNSSNIPNPLNDARNSQWLPSIIHDTTPGVTCFYRTPEKSFKGSQVLKLHGKVGVWSEKNGVQTASIEKWYGAKNNWRWGVLHVKDSFQPGKGDKFTILDFLDI